MVGLKRNINMSDGGLDFGHARCPDCGGSGDCPKCFGTGVNVALNSERTKCPTCNGSGKCPRLSSQDIITLDL